jgi:hypothetical protein
MLLAAVFLIAMAWQPAPRTARSDPAGARSGVEVFAALAG